MSRRYRDFPQTPCSHTYIASFIISLPHQNGTIVTTDKPALMQYNHSMAIVYITVHFCCYGSMGLGKSIMTYIDHYNILKSIFIALKILYALSIHLSPSHTPLATTDLSAVSIVLSFPICHIVGIMQYVAFSDWLLSLSNMHLRFLLQHSFLSLCISEFLPYIIFLLSEEFLLKFLERQVYWPQNLNFVCLRKSLFLLHF